MSELPEWLQPVAEGARTITADHLTRFVPPPDAQTRKGAVLMLFAESSTGDPELLLTERAHHMRSHPGQVSFPGGHIDPGESVLQAALREAWEEIGLVSDEIEVFGELPELWLPPTNMAVTPVLGYWQRRGEVRASPAEVHAIHHVALAELLDPANRITVRHPSGWLGPGFLIGEDHDLILWGFTAGIISRLFDYLGWGTEREPGEVRDLPAHMLQGEHTRADLAPNTKLRE
ncbi:NUDIX hydrolase [Nocardioides houyundeii]|uniref:NUDIX hydrolase n=1 Tax=Nocardioides houyundeii TaxID=2045452 RepID=UPI000C7625CE|nr:CoA pyrophosphatase [Nocardioides houyundeii]